MSGDTAIAGIPAATARSISVRWLLILGRENVADVRLRALPALRGHLHAEAYEPIRRRAPLAYRLILSSSRTRSRRWRMLRTGPALSSSGAGMPAPTAPRRWNGKCGGRAWEGGAGRVQITLLDRHNYFAVYPLLVEAGTGSLEPRHAVIPIRSFPA